MFIKFLRKNLPWELLEFIFYIVKFDYFFHYFGKKLPSPPPPPPPQNKNYTKTLLRMYHKNLVIWLFCFSKSGNFFSCKTSLFGSKSYISLILRQKKNYGNSNISPLKNIIFKKSSKTNQNHSRYYNSITKSHNPKSHFFRNRPIIYLPRGQNALSYYTL
jgi:hypothetical protein